MSKLLLTPSLGVALLLGGTVPISAQQAQDAGQAFALLDTDKDGKLSQAEFSRLFEMEGKEKVSEQEKQQEFKAWDVDGDGSISKAEFIAKYGK